MKKPSVCNPNHGCRDVQLKNTIDGFNQLISTYNRLSVCSTKSDGDQLWKELTSGITLFRRTISKLESKAFDHLSRRFATTCVANESVATQKTVSSNSLHYNSAAPVEPVRSQETEDNNETSTWNQQTPSAQPKYSVMKDKDGAIVVQQSPPPEHASPAKTFEPYQKRTTGDTKRNTKVDGWGDPIGGSTDSERSRSPVLNKADIVDFPEPQKTSIICAPPPKQPVNEEFEEDDDNYCSDTLKVLAPRLPLSVPFRAGDVFNARLLCVVSPLEFYVIKESHLARLAEIETILDSVANHLLTQPLTPELCNAGGACLVLTGEHISRATIRIGIAGAKELQIFLVDYGRAQFVPATSCYAMPKCIANMAPPLAHNCSVLGADSRLLDHAALTAFNEAVMGKDEVQLRASGTSRASHGELVEIVGGARLAALPSTRPSRNQMSAGDICSSPFTKSLLKFPSSNQTSRAEISSWSNEFKPNKWK